MKKMRKFKQLTTEERRIVIEMHKNGDSYRKIAKRFEKTPAAIFRIVTAYKKDGRVSVLARSGRPRLAFNRTDTRIKNISIAFAHIMSEKIRAKLIEEGKEVPSAQTIRRLLHGMERHGRLTRKFPYTMSDKEKKRFHEMAEKDKKRYDTEMQNYTPPKGESKGRGKKRKHIKDHNAPKRSLSAFFWFCNDERGKVKMLNPEFGVGDIAKELGKKWSDADPETKSKYEAMAEKDKARYEKEMTAYKKKIKDGAPVVANPVNAVKSDSEEEYKEDDE